MSGVVLETLNIRKLVAFAILLLIAQVIFFLIGGLIAPSPHTNDQILMTKCVDRELDMRKWFFMRPQSSNFSCKELLPEGDLDKVVPPDVKAGQIVFMAQFPHPRGGVKLRMTRWFQQVVAVLMLDVKYKSQFQVKPNAEITFDVRLGYRNHGDADHDWKEIAFSREIRPLKCTLDAAALKHQEHGHPINDGFYYDCEVLPLFSLGSCHYDHYIVNLRIPIDTKMGTNTDIGMLQDVWMVEIHQNGGFTKVWFSLKTVVFPTTLAALVFFWHRVRELPRQPNLLEKTIFSLGVVISFLNCPIEWLSLIFNASFWLVLSDIRQGAFYATLVCFWLVFTGEHMMEENEDTGNRQRIYWPKLILVAGCCSALCIFELAERGVQIKNPFYSIWSHPLAAKMAMASVIVGGICACCYFFYLAFMVLRALYQIFKKRRLLAKLPGDRQRYYTGVIYRFTILLVYTLICASLTVVFFIFSQVNEDQWKWGRHRLEYTSAFITGVYGMWNVYVIAVLCLYAPSHKFRSASGQALLEQLSTNQSTISADHPPEVVFTADHLHSRLPEHNEIAQSPNDTTKVLLKLQKRERRSVVRADTPSSQPSGGDALNLIRKVNLE